MLSPAAPEVSSCTHVLKRSASSIPNVKAIVAVAAEAKAPVLIHAGAGVGSFGSTIVELAAGHRQCPIILAHAGISDLSWLSRVVPDQPNLFSRRRPSRSSWVASSRGCWRVKRRLADDPASIDGSPSVLAELIEECRSPSPDAIRALVLALTLAATPGLVGAVDDTQAAVPVRD